MKFKLILIILLAPILSLAAKPGKAELKHKLGTITVFNQWIDGEPVNEPYQLFVTIQCKYAAKKGKMKNEIVRHWANCGLQDMFWDKFSGLLKLEIKHNNEKTNYKECSFVDKRELKIEDYCLPKKSNKTKKKK